jgi:predicted kinase
LVVLRGNSGSGKTSTAMALRARLGRGLALVQQDVMRRMVLKERDVPRGANIGLISMTTRYALDHGYDVILAGIMHAERYADMLCALVADHRGHTVFYYFDVSFAETLRRHATRPEAREFGVEDMRGWYRDRDLLSFVEERIITESAGLEDTVDRVLRDVFPDHTSARRDPHQSRVANDERASS